MNNEQQELLDEVYENYSKEYEKDNSIGMCLLVARTDGKSTYRKPNKEMFIDLCTLDTEFSEKWGLKIEDRELTWDESNEYYNNHQSLKVPYLGLKVPTKLITVTYNDKRIESYE